MTWCLENYLNINYFGSKQYCFVFFQELESEFDQCAVCIEGYKASDVIRILPCKYVVITM